MNKETAKVISEIKQYTIYDLLNAHGVNFSFDSYNNHAHRTGYLNEAELEDFCRKIYENWYKRIYAAYQDFIRKHPGQTDPEFEKLFNGEYTAEKIAERGNNNMPIYNFVSEEFSKEFPSLKKIFYEQDGSFLHIYEYNFFGRPSPHVDCRLYLNIKAENSIEFSRAFWNKASKYGLSSYFKFGYSDTRNDPWLLYSSYDDVPMYIQIIEEIKQERPDLLEGTEITSANMGVINGYIGYGEEPKQIAAGGGLEDFRLGDERLSHTSRLENVVNSIYRKLVGNTKTMFRKKGITVFEPNNDRFGTYKGNFEQFFNYIAREFIDARVDAWLKSPVGVKYLSENPGTTREMIISYYYNRLRTQMVENIASGKPIENIESPHYPGLIIYTGHYKFTEIYTKALPELRGASEAQIRATVARYALWESSEITPEKLRFLNAVTGSFYNDLLQILEKDPTDPRTLQMLEHIQSRRFEDLDAEGQAIIILIATQYANKKPGLIHSAYLPINGKRVKVGVNFFDILSRYNGKEKVDAIVIETCKRFNVDPENCFLNATTKEQIDQALSGEDAWGSV